MLPKAPKEKKEKIPFYFKYFKILIVLLIIVILLPGYIFLVRAKLASYHLNKNSVDTLQETREQNLKKLLSYNKIILSYNNITSSDQAKINQMMPVGINLADLYINVASLVESAGLELTDMQVIESKEEKRGTKTTTDNTATVIKGELKTANISLNILEVTYSRLKDLLTSIEENIKLLDVQSFSYNPSDGSLNIIIKTYYIE